MSCKAIYVHIIVADEDTGEVKSQFVDRYTGGLGWEVKKMFSQLGDKLAVVADPGYEV